MAKGALRKLEGTPIHCLLQQVHLCTLPYHLLLLLLLLLLLFQVFGLGNKTYEHYNAIGKYFDERLAELGAERVFKRGEGDDDGK